MKKKLFICTKPYQYLICRLIFEGFQFDAADIIILNHFEGAFDFVCKLKQSGIWNQVYFIDDSKLNQFSSVLNPVKKIFFYNNWRKYLPNIEINYDDYDSLYFAHDGVATEYAVMRNFKRDGKAAIIYEEGYGNYVNINTHKYLKSFLKEFSHLFNIPGSYIGRLKFVDKILLQYPDIVIKSRLPIAKKVDKLPMSLDKFLGNAKIQKELFELFPCTLNFSSASEIFLILGETFNSEIDYINFIENTIQLVQTNLRAGSVIIFKPHPGETQDYSISHRKNLVVIPKNLPIEMLYIYGLRNCKKLCIYTYGSTAAINLYMMLRNVCKPEIIILTSNKIPYKDEIAFIRFRELAKNLNVKYRTLKI